MKAIFRWLKRLFARENVLLTLTIVIALPIILLDMFIKYLCEPTN